MIALIDYGAGNLASVRKALAALGADVITPRDPGGLAQARGVIVPGVGHFAATRALDDGWRAAVRERLDQGAALLGICLGLQWLFEGSDEAPDVPGLGLLEGTCSRLPATNGDGTTPMKVPHVGWNTLTMPRETSLLRGIAPGSYVYFTHSYAAPIVADTAAITSYGRSFTAAVERGRAAGVQFHPEKSGEVGLTVLRNWLDAV